MFPPATTFSVSVPLTRLTVPRAGQLHCRQSDGVVAGAARQGLDVRHRASGEVHRRGIGKDDRVAVGAAIDRLARGEVAVGQVDRVVAAARRDRVGTRAAEDEVCRCAAGQDVATAESVYCSRSRTSGEAIAAACSKVETDHICGGAAIRHLKGARNSRRLRCGRQVGCHSTGDCWVTKWSSKRTGQCQCPVIWIGGNEADLRPGYRQTGNNHRVVGAQNAHRHRRRRAVRTPHLERLTVGRPGNERVVGRARRVAPHPRRIDREGAVGPRRPGLRHEGCRTVDVADRQRPARRQYRVGFTEANRRRRQHRRVVGAQNVHRHRRRRVVRTPHLEGLTVGRPGNERVVGRARRVAPHPRRIDREGAVGPYSPGLRHEACRTVDVADRQRPARRQYRVGFTEANRRRRQHRRVVGAQNVHRHRRRRVVRTPHLEGLTVDRPGNERVVG